MSRTKYTQQTGEPVTHEDYLELEASQIWERLGAHVSRYGYDATAEGLQRVGAAYALLLDAPISRAARFDLRVMRQSILVRIDLLDRQANLRFAGMATREEHLETLGALSEACEFRAAIDTVLAHREHG
jgi:hypothetical protein